MARERKVSLVDKMEATIGNRIVNGDHAPNDVFQIADLCTEFDASRTVLREAIKSLTSKGLVTSRASVGTIVLPQPHWNLSDPDVLEWFLHATGTRLPLIREFNDFRLGIEPSAAALAASRSNTADIAKIFSALERMRAAENGLDHSLDADVEFHVAILHATGNRFFINMRHTIAVALRISIGVTNRQKSVTVASAADHAKIADAIGAGDADNAAHEMRALLLEARRLLCDSTLE